MGYSLMSRTSTKSAKPGIKPWVNQTESKLPDNLRDNTVYKAYKNPGVIQRRPGSKSYFSIGVSFDREGNIIYPTD